MEKQLTQEEIASFRERFWFAYERGLRDEFPTDWNDEAQRRGFCFAARFVMQSYWPEKTEKTWVGNAVLSVVPKRKKKNG